MASVAAATYAVAFKDASKSFAPYESYVKESFCQRKRYS